jgi:hypothetical protein
MPISSDDTFPIPDGPIKNPCQWQGRDFQGNESWITRWSGQALAELIAAVETVKRAGKKAPKFTKADFPLPSLAAELQAIRDDLETGNGFSILRGIPSDDLSDDDAEILFWGMIVHLGQPMSQNSAGHLLGHVRDLGLTTQDTKVRNYQTTEELFFHNDSCDVLMLLCRRTAKKGGQSRLASIPTLFNAMWAEDPALTAELFRPFAFDRRGEPGRPDEPETPYFVLPIMNWSDGLITARMVPRGYIRSAQRYDDAPRLTPRMDAAIDLMERVSVRPECSFAFDLEPGDVELVNNYAVFHARTDYVDHEDPDKKRHMLRAWLSVPNSRPLPPWFKERWGSIAPGEPRGGIYAARPAATSTE